MPRLSDLNDMLFFIAVIDAGSFTLAADRLNIPKANLSRKISRLEKQLGVMLLERSTRSQRITETGKSYLAHCRRIQQEIDEAEASISQTLNKIEGTVRIGASVGIGQQILKPALGEFMHQNPDVDLHVSLMNRRVDLIEEGYDLVIRIGKLDDSRLVAKKLGEIKRNLYASPDYVERHGEFKELENLNSKDFLLMSSILNRGRFILESGAEQQEFLITPKMLADDFSILKQMAIEGLGIAIIPDYMCSQEQKAGSLIQILPQWSMTKVDVYALYPKHRLSLPKVKAFMTFIQDEFKQQLVN